MYKVRKGGGRGLGKKGKGEQRVEGNGGRRGKSERKGV